MLLTIDIGNTNTVIGVYDGATLVDHLRIESRRSATEDEYGALITTLLERRDLAVAAIGAAIIGSVVPPLTEVFTALCERWLGVAPLVVGPGVRTGMPILYENPREVGADRIVNAVAAVARWGAPIVVVDFGTATTLDCVNHRKEYVGGAIAPGLKISEEALFSRTAKLPRVDIARPPSAIGTNTVHAMQSGLFYGYVGLVDGLAQRIRAELDVDAPVVATGGLATLVASASSEIREVDPHLTLRGLAMLYEMNATP